MRSLLFLAVLAAATCGAEEQVLEQVEPDKSLEEPRGGWVVLASVVVFHAVLIRSAYSIIVLGQKVEDSRYIDPVIHVLLMTILVAFWYSRLWDLFQWFLVYAVFANVLLQIGRALGLGWWNAEIFGSLVRTHTSSSSGQKGRVKGKARKGEPKKKL
jgi:hypothetical protein